MFAEAEVQSAGVNAKGNLYLYRTSVFCKNEIIKRLIKGSYHLVQSSPTGKPFILSWTFFRYKRALTWFVVAPKLSIFTGWQFLRFHAEHISILALRDPVGKGRCLTLKHSSPNINIRILLSVPLIFLMVLVGRICTNIKTFHVWWSFPLFLWPVCLFK